MGDIGSYRLWSRHPVSLEETRRTKRGVVPIRNRRIPPGSPNFQSTLTSQRDSRLSGHHLTFHNLQRTEQNRPGPGVHPLPPAGIPAGPPGYNLPTSQLPKHVSPLTKRRNEFSKGSFPHIRIPQLHRSGHRGKYA